MLPFWLLELFHQVVAPGSMIRFNMPYKLGFCPGDHVNVLCLDIHMQTCYLHFGDLVEA